MSKKLTGLIRKCVYDKNGKVVLAQSPNLPIIFFVIASILAVVFNRGSTGYLFKVLAFGSIFTWAWMEIFSGVNYFRRALGLVVVVLSITSAIMYLSYLS
jgi:hypothetical protein